MHDTESKSLFFGIVSALRKPPTQELLRAAKALQAEAGSVNDPKSAPLPYARGVTSQFQDAGLIADCDQAADEKTKQATRLRRKRIMVSA